MFRAYDPDRERLVAIKHFRLDLPPERVHRLIAALEAVIAATPAHPAIVMPIAAGMEGVTAYLAEEYVAGDSLDVVLRQLRQSSVRDALRVAAQLAGALEAAADVGIHHGAIHPRDVLLAGDETKLTGLGIVGAIEAAGVAPPLRRPYTAPEQAEKTAWDRRADVFALVAIVYEMLWGRRVSGTGRDIASSMTDALGGDLKQLREVFERGLAEDPAARFDSPLDFAEALTAAFSTRAIPLVEQPEIVSLAPLEGAVPAEPSAVEAVPPAAAAPRAPRGSPGGPGNNDDFEPRLPLDGDASDQLEGDLRLFSPEPPADAPQNHDAAIVVEDVPPPVIAEPAQARDTAEPAASIASLPDVEPRLKRASIDPELPVVYQPVPEAVGRTRAFSPLAFALVIGIALGFAAGFAVGLRRSGALADTAATTTVEQAAATTGAAAEVGERPAAGNPPSAAIATPPQPAPAQEAPVLGSLLVRSTPAGARVFVDGRDRGVAPVTVNNLARGTHRVRVTHDGYVTDEQQFTITPAQQTHSVTIRLSPQPRSEARPAPGRASAVQAAPAAPRRDTSLSGTGALAVDSRPPGARVFVDGKFVGTTPMMLPEVAAGDHAVHLELEGYQRWATAVRIVPSENNRVAASMDR